MRGGSKFSETRFTNRAPEQVVHPQLAGPVVQMGQATVLGFTIDRTREARILAQ